MLFGSRWHSGEHSPVTGSAAQLIVQAKVVGRRIFLNSLLKCHKVAFRERKLGFGPFQRFYETLIVQGCVNLSANHADQLSLCSPKVSSGFMEIRAWLGLQILSLVWPQLLVRF